MRSSTGRRGLRAVGPLLVVALLVSVALVVVIWARPTQARPLPPPFIVNSTADLEDATLDDSPNACDTGRFVLGVGPECTFRAAIQEANNTSGADRIHFNIPGTGVKTIQPLSGLPFIVDKVTIDGYTQRPCSTNPAPCSKPNTKAVGTNASLLIELKGSDAGNAGGLFLSSQTTGNTSSGSLVRGLVINDFERSGISIAGDGGSTIEGNFIGTDPSGTADVGNRFGVVIGGGAGSIIGGNTRGARNLISGNDGSGIDLGCCGGHVAQGNLIGTKKDGTTALGNTFSGVRAQGANHIIGGVGAAAANTIAFNGGDGVEVDSDSENINNRILGNSIFSNTGLGIEIPPTGPNPNDAGDADTGGNGSQNKPVLTSATTSSGTTIIEGRLNSKPSTTFTIQFFSNPSGNEGKVFRGQLSGQRSVTTNANGNATFAFSPASAVPSGQTITATATGTEGTSEFSAPRTVVAG